MQEYRINCYFDENGDSLDELLYEELKKFIIDKIKEPFNT